MKGSYFHSTRLSNAKRIGQSHLHLGDVKRTVDAEHFHQPIVDSSAKKLRSDRSRFALTFVQECFPQLPTREHRLPTREYSVCRSLPRLEDSQSLFRPFPTRRGEQRSRDVPSPDGIRTMTLFCKSLHSSREKKRTFSAFGKLDDLTEECIDCPVVKIVKFIHETAGEEFGNFVSTAMEVQSDQRIATDGEIIGHAHILEE